MIDSTFLAMGIISIILVLSSTFVGILMIYKYTKYKYRPFLFWGLLWIVIMKGWWIYVFNFILVLMGEDYLSPEISGIVGYGLEPISFILWMIAWVEVTYKEKFKFTLIILIIFTIIYQIIFWSLFLTDPSLVVESRGVFDYRSTGIIQLITFCELIVFLVLSTVLFYKGHKTVDKEIRLKSTLFLVQIILIFFGMMLDVAFGGFEIFIISRILMILSPIFLYISQVFPKWARRIFLRST
ncbi:MAG: hypothetical protein ACFFAH_06320 [Promethearchaeota archaeon]